MKVAAINSNLNIINNTVLKVTNKNYTNLTFGTQDTFERSKQNTDKQAELFKILENKRKSLAQEASLIDKNLPVIEQIKIRESLISKMDNLESQYEMINKMLSKSDSNHVQEDYEIISEYIKALMNMPPNKGFNRIVGYNNIKNALTNNFIMGKILKSKLSSGNDVIVPDIMVFYGPTGCGKTTFAKALAEESQSNIFPVIDLSEKDNDKAFDEIKKDAIKAQEIYKNNNKQRSIIVVNEAEVLFDDINNPKIHELINFCNDCSERYKCTLFLTTNYPKYITKGIFKNNNIKTLTIGLEAPNREISKGVFVKALNDYQLDKKLTDNEINDIILKLFAHNNERYSSSNIISIVESTKLRNKNPDKNDFYKSLRQVLPSITPDQLEDYENFKEYIDK